MSAPRHDPSSSPAYEMIEARSPRQFAAGAALFNEYASQLGVDLRFQGFAGELEQLPQMYGPPSGCLLLIMRGGTAVGCGAVRRLADGVCEMKRLYVKDAARGAQLGRRLAVRLVRRAQHLGYHTMRLDTLTEMAAARSLYRSLGFREIAPYYDNPLANPVYMELTITGLDVDGGA